MSLPVRLSLALGLIPAVLACMPAPAEARLGDKIEAFSHSKLIQGDRHFHFEGRTGARYRFSGARRCRFGQGLLAVDVENQRIVQQILVLPLPTVLREEATIREVAALFVADLGLDLPPTEHASVMASFVEAMQTGKRIERSLGKHYEMRVYCQPQRGTIMMVVGLKPA